MYHPQARSKTRSSRKTRKPQRISFPRFSTPSFPFCTIPKTENSELKTSEFSLRHYNQLTPRFSNSEFSIFHYTQTENSELKTSEVSLRFTQTTTFLLNCVTYSNSEFFQLRGFVFALPYIPNRKLGDGKPLEFDQTALERTPRFSSPSFPF